MTTARAAVAKTNGPPRLPAWQSTRSETRRECGLTRFQRANDLISGGGKPSVQKEGKPTSEHRGSILAQHAEPVNPGFQGH